MRKILAALLLALSFWAVPSFAQTQALISKQNGITYAPAYATWRASVVSGPSASGSGTVVVQPAFVTLTDGRTIAPFSTTTPVSVDGDVQTPSAVSIGPCPVGVSPAAYNCASITATWAAGHPGALNDVTSGDNGIQEAIVDAGASGGGLVYWQADTGIVTLSTSGLTTTSTTFVPTNFYNMGAAARVTTTITTSTNWAVGISGATSIFCSANATLTAGTTCLANQASPASTGTTSALTAVLITVTGANAGAGAVKARVWGWTPVQASN